MKRPATGLSTRAIHGTRTPPNVGDPVASPVYQSATFLNPIGSAKNLLYTRYGNNPNQIALGEKLAALEGAEDAVFLASGMGATSLSLMSVLSAGDHLISSNWIYGGTRKLLVEEFQRLGIAVSFADPTRPDGWKRHIKRATRAVFVETPTNPQIRLIDLDPIAELCNSKGLHLLVDSSIASPINFRPLEHGADMVIHSVTKYLNGHADVIAGAVAASRKVISRVRELLKMWGQAIDPHAAWLIERALKTLAVRVPRHNSNAQEFAEWACEHPKISNVVYPGLDSHPDHGLAARILDGYGGLVGVTVKGGTRAANKLLRKLRLATHAPSFGGTETLVSVPRFTSHAGQTKKQLRDAGIPEGYLRISIGIEEVQDIIFDFARALDSV